MIDKAKRIIAVFAFLILIAAAAFIYALLQRHAHLSLENKNLAAEVSALGHRLKLSQDSSDMITQKKKIHGKSSMKDFGQDSSGCRRCLESAEMEIELKDEKGWWRYYDPNVFDEEAGTFRLTERFWKEALPPAPDHPYLSDDRRMETYGKRKRIRLASEKSIRAGVGLSGCELEMSYSPLAFRGEKWSLGMDIRSRVQTRFPAPDHIDQMAFDPYSLKADLGLGLTLRW